MAWRRFSLARSAVLASARIAGVAFVGSALFGFGTGASAADVQAGSTHWQVRTSLGFDALCALNILSGDDFYVSRYPAEAQRFAGEEYATARAEARELKRIIKDEEGGIVSAFLTLVLSAADDRTLDALIAAAGEPAQLEATLMRSPFAAPASWRRFERARPHVLRALQSMKAAGFEEWWRSGIEPKSSAQADALLAALARHDVLGEQRRLIGPAFGVRDIEVILLHFSKPHGIRIQGDRYLTNSGYPAEIVLRNAAHEPLHGVLDLDSEELRALVKHMTSGKLIERAIAKHDPSFGYNTPRGYAEEDLVQALDQVVAERLGFAIDSRKRWREGDGGMHVLAASLYELMQETGFARAGGNYRDWLLAAAARGELSEGAIERRARARLGDDAVEAWLAK